MHPFGFTIAVVENKNNIHNNRKMMRNSIIIIIIIINDDKEFSRSLAEKKLQYILIKIQWRLLLVQSSHLQMQREAAVGFSAAVPIELHLPINSDPGRIRDQCDVPRPWILHLPWLRLTWHAQSNENRYHQIEVIGDFLWLSI